MLVVFVSCQLSICLLHLWLGHLIQGLLSCTAVGCCVREQSPITSCRCLVETGQLVPKQKRPGLKCLPFTLPVPSEHIAMQALGRESCKECLTMDVGWFGN